MPADLEKKEKRCARIKNDIVALKAFMDQKQQEQTQPGGACESAAFAKWVADMNSPVVWAGVGALAAFVALRFTHQ